MATQKKQIKKQKRINQNIKYLIFAIFKYGSIIDLET